MVKKNMSAPKGTACIVIAIFFIVILISQHSINSQSQDRVFELRTYTTIDGRIDQLITRHRDGAIPIFEKHGMTVIGFWKAAEAPRSENTLTYVLAHKSLEAAKQSWEAFSADPQRDEYEHELIVENVERMFLHPTDFSAIK